MQALVPNQRLRLTREGRRYLLVWFLLMFIGLYLQSNLVLLIAGLAAGPLVASIFLSASVVKRLEAHRRVPGYAFAGGRLDLDYTLVNHRRRLAALATCLEDRLESTEGSVWSTALPQPSMTFARVPGRGRHRERWSGLAPSRGKYRFSVLDVITRSPFGLIERRVTLDQPAELVVYPRVGQLQRRWHQLYREASETKSGSRHDRSTIEQEYHGLRDYRPGDTLRWIHWRTTARMARPMVKEYEQQNEQDLAILIDPWLPRSRVTKELRRRLEDTIEFAASLCFETCRKSGRRIVLGWTGPVPGLCQGFASVKLLHELLARLATMRSSPEGSLAGLLDTLPAPILRDGLLVVLSTRTVHLVEEQQKSARLAGSMSRGLAARTILLDVSHADLGAMIDFNRVMADLVTTTAQPSKRAEGPMLLEKRMGP